MRNAFALNMNATHGGGIEQHVDQVVVQQVDLIDVEHAAVGTGQQARRESVLTVAEHLLQIQRPDHPVLGCADRQFHQPGVVVDRRQDSRQAAYRSGFRGPLLPADQHSADLGVNRAQ
ncbi:hypothetical protein A5669_19290 [Mycolicibacterium fortuitum]|nr:hypothetical protein A5669_19290 [Mycolicibacterium fortuitum]